MRVRQLRVSREERRDIASSGSLVHMLVDGEVM